MYSTFPLFMPLSSRRIVICSTVEEEGRGQQDCKGQELCSPTARKRSQMSVRKKNSCLVKVEQER